VPKHLAIKVEKTLCNLVLSEMRKLNALERHLKIDRKESFVYIPIKRERLPLIKEKLRGSNLPYKVVVHSFSTSITHKKDLASCLRDTIPPELLQNIPQSYDIIGDIVIVELKPEIYPYKKEVGEALLSFHHSVRLVLNKIGDIKGRYRVGEYEILAGEGPTETVHKEYGCKFKLDISKVFYTPRLSTERIRIVNQTSPSEVVCDLFAGVGPFSILIAKKKGALVYSVDINPHAVKYLKTNISLNKVERYVIPLLGDASQLSKGPLKGRCNRVIMNLPAGAHLFLDAASDVLKREGGVVHLHLFSESPKPENWPSLYKSFRELGWAHVELMNWRRVRETGPRKFHLALDIIVKSRRNS